MIAVELAFDVLKPSINTLHVRTALYRFSGAKIYPGKGIRFVCADSQVVLNEVLC